MIRLRFVGQFDPEGEIMLGHHARWREDEEFYNLQEVAQELVILNGLENKVIFPRFFTWVQQYAHDETVLADRPETKEIFVSGIADPQEDLLAGYQGQSEREEIFI